VDTTHRAFAEALGAPEAFFAKSSKKHVSNLVALRYPPVADPSDAGFPLERVRPHTDPTDVTVLLFEDGPRGLQVLPDWANGANAWIDPAPEDAGSKTKTKLLVNLGDATQFWTNDLWRSTRHRVVVRDAEDARRDRLSLVFFHAPDYDARVDARALAEAQKEKGELGEEKKVVSASRPARYPPFEASDRTHFAQLARDARGARDRQVIDANTNERVGLTEQ
jgi:isopenicillin N synthase-like dioxygenase